MTMLRILAAPVLAGLLLATASCSPAGAGSNGYTIGVESVQVPLHGWQPPAMAPTLRASIAVDRPDRLYRPGDLAQIRVAVNRDAHVVVLHLDARGTVKVLFPNAYAAYNLLPAHRPVDLGSQGSGFGLQVPHDAQPGGHMVKVIASTRPIEWLVGIPRVADSGPYARLAEDPGRLAQRFSVIAQSHPQVEIATAEMVYGVLQPLAMAPQAPPAFVPAPPAASAPTALPASVRPPSDYAPIPSAHDQFGLRIDLGRSRYREGEPITLTASAERRCSLILLDVHADGRYRILTPVAPGRPFWLEPGRTAFLPAAGSAHEFQASRVGEHSMVALCTARETLAQWLFGRTQMVYDETSRTQVVLQQPSLQEVMDARPDGDAASAVRHYLVDPA